MLGLMPCGKGEVQDWPQTEERLRNFIDSVKTERGFGFAEVDIEVPRELWPKFQEMPPLFYNKPVVAFLLFFFTQTQHLHCLFVNRV